MKKIKILLDKIHNFGTKFFQFVFSKYHKLKLIFASSELINTPQKQLSEALEVLQFEFGRKKRPLSDELTKNLRSFPNLFTEKSKPLNPISRRQIYFNDYFEKLGESFIYCTKEILIPNCERFSNDHIQQVQSKFQTIMDEAIGNALQNQETYFNSYANGVPSSTKQSLQSQGIGICRKYKNFILSTLKQSTLIKKTERSKKRIEYLRQLLFLLIGFLLGYFLKK